MRTETVEHFLESLAARSPAPGGRTGAALHAAQGAALVAKAARDAESRVGSPSTPTSCARPARGQPGRRRRRAGTGPSGTGRLSAEVIAVAAQVLALAEAIRARGPPHGRRRSRGGGRGGPRRGGHRPGRRRGGPRRITDPGARERLLTAIEPVDDLVLRAAKLTAFVREQILR